MKRPELLAAWRSLVDDEAQPYLWDDDDAQRYLDAAHREAAARARLIRDSTTAAVCSVAVVANTAGYALHASIIDVERAKLSTDTETLELTSTEELDRTAPGWESLTGSPSHLALDREGLTFKATLAAKPSAASTMSLVVFRLPLASINSDDDSPEFAEQWHYGLIKWMAHLSYCKQDAETRNDAKAKQYADEFTEEFGQRPDANVARKRADRRSSRTRFRELG